MQLKPITAIIVLSLVVASLLVSGCTSTPTPTSGPSTVGPAKETVTAIPANVREQVSAINVTLPQQIGPYAPKADYKFVGFNVTIKNINVNSSSVNAGDWTLRDTEGNIYQTTIATYSTAINGLKNVYTQPGDNVSGIIVYEVPQNVTLKSLTYYSGYQRTILPL